MRVLIVGNGIAGETVAFSLRFRRPEVEISMLSAEEVPAYDPCSLPYYVGGDVAREIVFRRELNDYKKHNIAFFPKRRAVSIDTEEHLVVTEGGEAFPYDKLVLAHGGSLFRPPIEGIDKKGIFSCKTLSDADALAAHQGTRAVIIGSGAIGVEVAEALKKKGYEVTIVELLPWILPTLFDEPTAKRLEKALLGYGIPVRTAEKVLGIEGKDRVGAVVTDKTALPCDTVVLATGVVPGRALAETAGIKVGRGIKVNERMETSLPEILACGDCVETFDAFTGEECCLYQLKHNAVNQARVVVGTLLGGKERYIGAYAFARAHFFSTHAASMGKTLKGVEGSLGVEILERERDGDYLRLIFREGFLLGAQAIGSFADMMGLLMAMMWRRYNFGRVREDLENLRSRDLPYPWTYGQLVGILDGRKELL